MIRTPKVRSSYCPTLEALEDRICPVITDPNLVFSVPFVSKPAYLTPITDPIFGSQITRIAGDPGQSLTTLNDGAGTWSTDARHEYSNIQPWNATGSLIMIENTPGGGGSPSKLFLDGNTYQVKYGNPSNLPLGNYEYRWDPSPSLANELIVFGNSTLEWFNVVANTVNRSWTLPFAITASGKQNTSQDGRFIALFDPTRMFVVDMDPPGPHHGQQRIGPVFDLGAEGLPYTIDHVSISPSGKYVLVHYHGDYQRVFDVDPNTLALTPQPMTCFYPGTTGTAAQGFIYQLGHPDMTLDPFDNNEDVVIGEEENGNRGQNLPGIATVGGDGISHVVMVRLRDGLATSLTDYGNGATVAEEAFVDHVSARNVDRPGWVYISYFPQEGRRFNDEIVAVKLDGSGSVERLAQAHSNFDGIYRAEAHAVPSPDGKRLLFASNWELNGDGQLNSIQDYVLDTRQANTLSVTGYPATQTAGERGTVTVIAQDFYGDTAAVYQGTVHFSSSDPQAAFPRDYTFTAADAGKHTFHVIFRTAGTQSLTVTDSQNSTLSGTQAGITVIPAAAKILVVAGFPSPTIAGTAQTFTATAEDPYGNIATGYTGTVHFTSSDPRAVLPADYTFTAADNGVQTFTATLETAGSQWLKGTDTVSSSIAGKQSGIKVQAAAASTLVVVGPSRAIAGTTYRFRVTAEDPYGNRAADYRGTVHFSSSDPQAVLPADYTFTAVDNAVHIFEAILKTAGSQALTVTDTALATITGSESLLVNSVAASQLRFRAPADVAAGSLDRLRPVEPHAEEAIAILSLWRGKRAAEELAALLAELQA